MVFEAIRRPEYTGERRCWPCTVANAAFVLFVALVAGVAWAPAAAAVLVVGGVVIALRGYVVPYTPAFAPKLVAPLPTSFGHGDAVGGERSGDLTGAVEVDGERLTRTLVANGVLVDDGGDLALSKAFRLDWEAEMASLRERDDGLLAAAVADAAPFAAEGRAEHGGVVVDGEGGRTVLSRPLAVADAAAVRALADWGVASPLRAAAAVPLRMFVETCPGCSGDAVETTVANCCGGTIGIYDSPERPVVACESCNEVLYEFDPVDDDGAQAG